LSSLTVQPSSKPTARRIRHLVAKDQLEVAVVGRAASPLYACLFSRAVKGTNEVSTQADRTPESFTTVIGRADRLLFGRRTNPSPPFMGLLCRLRREIFRHRGTLTNFCLSLGLLVEGKVVGILSKSRIVKIGWKCGCCRVSLVVLTPVGDMVSFLFFNSCLTPMLDILLVLFLD
jgi:hypothetical protein